MCFRFHLYISPHNKRSNGVQRLTVAIMTYSDAHWTLQSPAHLLTRATATYLRCHKVGSIARSHQQSVVSTQLLREAKVTDMQWFWGTIHVSIEQVWRLQITMNNLCSQITLTYCIMNTMHKHPATSTASISRQSVFCRVLAGWQACISSCESHSRWGQQRCSTMIITENSRRAVACQTIWCEVSNKWRSNNKEADIHWPGSIMSPALDRHQELSSDRHREASGGSRLIP